MKQRVRRVVISKVHACDSSSNLVKMSRSEGFIKHDSSKTTVLIDQRIQLQDPSRTDSNARNCP